MKIRSAAARELATPKYHQRIVKSKKAYTRKTKSGKLLTEYKGWLA